MPRWQRTYLLAVYFTLGAGAALAAESPQFRGPGRDGVFRAAGLLQSWPEAGPTRLWSVSGLGEGFSSVSAAAGRIYTTGAEDGQGFVVAFDTAGDLQWKRSYGDVHDGGGYPGARPTPTYNDGLLYVLSSMGKAMALDATSGEVRWEKELPIRNIDWGISESPLVVDDKAIFTPGGSEGTMMALDKKTGEAIWTTSTLRDPSAYCSPRLFDDGERRQVVTMTKDHMIGVALEDGEVLWQVDYPARYDVHAVSPVFSGGSIYVSDGHKQGGKMFDVAADGRSVTLEWEDRDLDVHHGGAVAVEGHIYGAASNGTWYALDAATGAAQSSIKRAGKGSVVYADGRLYGYVESGEVLLVDPDPENLEVVSRFKITEGRGQHWAHPVIADQVLYIRHGDVLMAFDIAGP